MTDPRTPAFNKARMAGGGHLDDRDMAMIHAALDAVGWARAETPAKVSGGFDAALAEILRHEGGYANHPADPGGRTMLGVTQRVWEAWTGRSATEADMRSLTPEKVAPVYRKNYWDVVHGDDMPPGLALCVFDFAVNAGPGRAARYLQSMLNVNRDGIIGPDTLAALKAFVGTAGEAEAVRRYQQARRTYYRQLGTFATFGRGWLRRVDEVETAALRLVK